VHEQALKVYASRHGAAFTRTPATTRAITPQKRAF
jgi:hypothetical protein